MLSDSMVGDWARDVETGSGRMMLAGIAMVGVFIAGFGVWASTAPIAGATVASGHVVAAGQNQKIQHLEGGIVDEILVREGESVRKGQPLFRLDRTAALALSDRLTGQDLSLAARTARLVAERDALSSLVFPPDLIAQAQRTGLDDILGEQANEFATKRQGHEQELLLLQRSISTLSEQLAGTQAQRAAVETQLAVVEQEIGVKRELLAQGLTNRSEYSNLLRTQADLIGQLGQARAGILAANSQIAEANEKTARLRIQRVETALSELNELRSQIPDVKEQLAAANAVLRRVEIRSPTNGTIVSIKQNTIGSVVQPGEVMLELLPKDDRLMVEARVLPQDIDLIAVGQEADLRFSALNSRTTPLVKGTLRYVSADRLIEPANQMPYYLARLEITQDLPAEIDATNIFPGMPVDTYIRTGDRTFFEYLVKPLTEGLEKAFREQ